MTRESALKSKILERYNLDIPLSDVESALEELEMGASDAIIEHGGNSITIFSFNRSSVCMTIGRVNVVELGDE